MSVLPIKDTSIKITYAKTLIVWTATVDFGRQNWSAILVSFDVFILVFFSVLESKSGSASVFFT